MALKTKKFTIEPSTYQDENGNEHTKTNRDTGKTYQVQEMPVLELDVWANRVLSAMASGGLSVTGLNLKGGLDVSSMGGIMQLAELAIQGFGNIAPHISQDLLNELVGKTVSFVTSGGSIRPLDIKEASDVEELSTLWAIRKEAFMLHVDFFTDASS